MRAKSESAFAWMVRSFLSSTFVLSSVGKLIDLPASANSIALLFHSSTMIAQMIVIIWTIMEIALAFLMWRKKISPLWRMVPLILLGVTLFGAWRGTGCGCFGSLPFLSQFSLISHLLLLGGMFLGFYYLSATTKTQQDKTERSLSVLATNKSSALQWICVAAVVMMASAFLSLPFSASTGRALESSSKDYVELADVEAAIVNHSAILVDARPEFQYEFGHIPASINIPNYSDNLSEVISRFSLQDHPLIVYCSGPNCNAAELLAQKLRRLGCKKVRVYPGGWEEWVSERAGDGMK